MYSEFRQIISVRGLLAVRSPWYNRDCKEAAQFTQSAPGRPRERRGGIDRSTANWGRFTPQIRNGEEEHNRGGVRRKWRSEQTTRDQLHHQQMSDEEENEKHHTEQTRGGVGIKGVGPKQTKSNHRRPPRTFRSLQTESLRSLNKRD